MRYGEYYKKNFEMDFIWIEEVWKMKGYLEIIKIGMKEKGYVWINI